MVEQTIKSLRLHDYFKERGKMESIGMGYLVKSSELREESWGMFQRGGINRRGTPIFWVKKCQEKKQEDDRDGAFVFSIWFGMFF